MQKLLESNEINDDFLKKIYDEHYICSKDTVNSDLILFYHKFYNNYIEPNTIQSEVRSIVYNKKTKKIVADCGPNPIYNDDAYKLIENKDLNSLHFVQYYDGPVMSVFFDTDKWYLSTRRCLDSNESYYNNDKSHYTLFNEVLENTEYKIFEKFTENLEKDKSYYFVLIHYKNKQVIDYSKEFNSEYKKLCLFSVRDEERKALNLQKNDFKFIDNKNIFIPEEIVDKNLSNLFSKNGNKVIYNRDVICYYENNLLIFNTLNYQLLHVKTHDKYPTISSLFFAYQNDLLSKYANLFENTIKINEDTYKTIEMLSVLLKTSSLFMLLMFKQLYSVTTGNPVSKVLKMHANIELNQTVREKLEKQAEDEEKIYNALPLQYKEILYAIRGIYYKKKANKNTYPNKTDSYLNVHDIYNYLKNLDVQKYILFLKVTNSFVLNNDTFEVLLENINNNMKKQKTYNVENMNKYYKFLMYVNKHTGGTLQSSTIKTESESKLQNSLTDDNIEEKICEKQVIEIEMEEFVL
jgi:hypothetical protein